MYVNYSTKTTTQHHKKTYARTQKRTKRTKVRSSRTTRIWALFSPVPSRQTASIHLTRHARVFFFQLGASRIWIWPTLALAGDLSIPCPGRIYTTSRSALLYIDHRVHSPVLPLPQVYIPACTYLCTSLYLYLLLPIPRPLPLRGTQSLCLSLPGWWFLTLTIPPRPLLLLPQVGSASVLSHDITLLSLSLSRPRSLFSLLVCLFCISFPIRVLRSCQERVRTCPLPAGPLSCHSWHRALTRHLHITHVHRPSQPVRCLSHMGVPMPAAVPHHRTLHCIACIVSRLALLLLWTNCSR